ncbi:response regulator transcription factor [Leucobacter viscericola]|uniref:Response regulator transcription factor n=1 Tax=Leucobacter viscericola TaxID=2714935 RepID=A0A6G7XG37_9MICO|nr:response regulator transcription factor [Leucobacter viscericola]QIK63525.1 response regulator transcription factor [Leucobacter viscericola]
MIRIVVVDDQAIVRDGLVTVLGLIEDFEVVGEAADGQAGLELVLDSKPDVVLMDLRMPKLDGVAATAQIHQLLPDTAVLVLSTFADQESIVDALRAGARGYLTKDAGRQQLEAGIRAVASGQTTLAPAVREAALSGIQTSHTADTAADDDLALRFPLLTAREREVVALITEGLSNSEIAVQLFLSVATVKSHINSIFAKFHVTTRAQLIAAALRR